MTTTTFGDLNIGQVFYFNRNRVSGLLADLDKPNTDEPLRKRTTRTYEKVTDGSVLSVGSVKARVWVAS